MRTSKRDLGSNVVIRDLSALYYKYKQEGGKSLENFKEVVIPEMVDYSNQEARIVKINYENEDPDGYYYKYKYRLKIDKKTFVWYEWMFKQEDGDDFCPLFFNPIVKNKQFMFDFMRE
jgi:hypothetical protein